ncbi:unnamed protein product [Rotaria sp. Silwood2]|nr:unnamed protein product [Rotaria sp. Silwood2]CAF2546085.1 unnamed protein product [Rotaria sp. Silwood2]CAF2797339.1 unnamed protein product [Rotaria sp. Silwood2]CAF3891131.1 unnamed protein product [Rotaria sp. Silwood2]CAF3958804.1 unnamed protein product [Rotaria sp. Silwood2]
MMSAKQRNTQHSVRSNWSKVCYQCQNEGHIAAECTQQVLSEWRLAELLQEQKTNFETLINEFQNKWNRNLLTLQTAPKTNAEQLLPVINDFTTVCNQLKEQNFQMQNQLNTITNRIQKTANETV